MLLISRLGASRGPSLFSYFLFAETVLATWSWMYQEKIIIYGDEILSYFLLCLCLC